MSAVSVPGGCFAQRRRGSRDAEGRLAAKPPSISHSLFHTETRRCCNWWQSGAAFFVSSCEWQSRYAVGAIPFAPLLPLRLCAKPRRSIWRTEPAKGRDPICVRGSPIFRRTDGVSLRLRIRSYPVTFPPAVITRRLGNQPGKSPKSVSAASLSPRQTLRACTVS